MNNSRDNCSRRLSISYVRQHLHYLRDRKKESQRKLTYHSCIHEWATVIFIVIPHFLVNLITDDANRFWHCLNSWPSYTSMLASTQTTHIHEIPIHDNYHFHCVLVWLSFSQVIFYGLPAGNLCTQLVSVVSLFPGNFHNLLVS